MNFKTHELIKTNIATSRSMRARAQSDTGLKSTVESASNETRRDKFQKPFPVKGGGADRDLPKNLPPTPPSESEGYGGSLQRSRSRSTPARSRSLAVRSSGSSSGSDYTPPLRPRLDTVRDEEDDDDVRGSEMRRTKSTGGRGDRGMNRSMSTRTPRGRREDRDDLYDIYGDYYEEKPMTRAMSTRRPLARANTMSRNRGSSSSRSRRQEEEDDRRYSDEEDDEFEMVTPKRSEITKVSLSSYTPNE